jgi:acyl-CoA synthetase (AMP-forming)/AMP-acid ligase II
MNLQDVILFYRVLKQTGALTPHPAFALSQFFACYLRYGSSLFTLAAWSALRFPHKVALAEARYDVTFQQLVHNAKRRAAHLRRSYGVYSEQTVGLLARNSIAFVETLLACELLGTKTVLLHTTFNAEDLTRVFGVQPFSLLLCDQEFEERINSFTQRAQKVLTGVVYLEHLTRETNLGLDFPNHARQSKLVLLSSGTTGPAKLIQQRPRLSPKTLAGLLENLKLNAGDKTLLTLPLLHGHGLSTLALTFLLGASLFLFARGSSEEYLQCIEEQAIKVLVVVPTVLYRLLEQAKNSSQTRTLSHIISGSAPLDKSLVEHTLQRFGNILFNLYGSSEVGLISLATPEDLQQTPNTVGHLLPGVDIQIIREGRLEVKQGSGYIGTGDEGYLDTSGKLFLRGRYDEMLICGGKNLHPLDLETQVQEKLEYVQEAAAVGIPDAEFGQSVHWFIVLKPNCDITSETLKRDLEAIFPKSVKPSHVSTVPALPKTPSGKIARYKLKREQVTSESLNPSS